jgi:hypothetical protein
MTLVVPNQLEIDLAQAFNDGDFHGMRILASYSLATFTSDHVFMASKWCSKEIFFLASEGQHGEIDGVLDILRFMFDKINADTATLTDTKKNVFKWLQRSKESWNTDDKLSSRVVNLLEAWLEQE